GRGTSLLDRGSGLAPVRYCPGCGRRGVRLAYARSSTYGCVVGFADGGSAVTVSAGLALIGKTPSGDTLRRGVIPVQRHATVTDGPAVSGRRPVWRLDVLDRATAAGTSRRRAPRRDRHHGDTCPGGEVLNSGEHAAPNRAG